jgi:hypothetical protein
MRPDASAASGPDDLQRFDRCFQASVQEAKARHAFLLDRRSRQGVHGSKRLSAIAGIALLAAAVDSYTWIGRLSAG